MKTQLRVQLASKVGVNLNSCVCVIKTILCHLEANKKPKKDNELLMDVHNTLDNFHTDHEYMAC